MAQSFFPFDAGSGADATETQWRRMARLWAPSSVETGLTVTAGTGATVNVAAGSAWVDGHYYANSASLPVSFATNSGGTEAQRWVVLRLDPTANTITAQCLSTEPTQTPTGIYDLVLATFTLPASGTAQTPIGIRNRAGSGWVKPAYTYGFTTLAGSTTNQPGSYRVRGTQLEFDGVIQPPSSTANPWCTLPAELRPASDIWVPVVSVGGAHLCMRIRSNGQVYFHPNSGTDGISIVSQVPLDRLPLGG